MRKNKSLFILIFVILICTIFLVSCSSNSNSSSNYAENEGGSSSESSSTTEIGGAIEGRKIIYTAYATINVDKPLEAVEKIKNSLNSDEWVDEETITSSDGKIIIRVKSSRIDEFLSSLSSFGTVGNYTKTSEDITLTYNDLTVQIETLNETRAAYVALYSSASEVDDLIALQEAISSIDTQLKQLNYRKNTYDSLIDYSKVTIYINQNYYEEDPTFASEVGNAFVGSWAAFLSFLKYLLIAIIYIIPFGIVGGIITVIVIFSRKKFKKAKTANNAKIGDKNIIDDSSKVAHKEDASKEEDNK